MSGTTALHVAVDNGLINYVTLLLQTAERLTQEQLLSFLNAADHEGNTVFMIAVRDIWNGPGYDMVNVLLGASKKLSSGQLLKLLNAHDEAGNTALQVAAHNGLRDEVMSLLDTARRLTPEQFVQIVSAKNNNGESASDLAIKTKNLSPSKASECDAIIRALGSE